MAEDPVAHNLSQAEHGKGMTLPPESGAKALTTEEGAHHPEPASFGIVDATVWVSIAMAAFIAILLWKKVPGLITRGLDSQIAAIKARLDEAKALRDEAEALRDEYARKIASVEVQAAEMVAHADEEAKALVAKAKKDADELVKRRGKMAEDKIAAAERAALDAVRARAADAAAKAAASIIAQKHDAGADKALVDDTIAGLSRLN
ncbi:F0F1 ATP synthase subunit B [Sphingomonas sp. BT-65]|uniref:F0F1 ATP synthase subunit B family protein n=1 Tax=Sphingomonas sp. BT-65 TaxID=2989821 RepID=UPI002235E4DA|nr:F0F1 ATP synthase subunit B [Sphingomonas sp. BT-65]MCW4461830.1 F0F1 ATP synthase subunit B [Sphingomonas sp. BT-65]